tara:strand:- start:4861 stop:5253 length:393 start_codon:yes stop_codon:yes gene_type:complete
MQRVINILRILRREFGLLFGLFTVQADRSYYDPLHNLETDQILDKVQEKAKIKKTKQDTKDDLNLAIKRLRIAQAELSYIDQDIRIAKSKRTEKVSQIDNINRRVQTLKNELEEFINNSHDDSKKNSKTL